MRHAWIRAVFVVVLMALIGGCDSSQKPETQSPSAESPSKDESASEQKAPDMSQQEATDTGAAEQPGNSSLWVMQPRGNRQCEGGGKSLASSGAELAQNGIKVQESRCGVRTDRMYPSVCGGATGDLLMHRIPASFLDAALELGFDPAKQGQYKLVDCPQMPAGGPQDR